MTNPSVHLSCAFLLLLSCSLISFEDSKSNKAIQYIEQFKDIAQREMQRSGIPASIKLAQGIHESGAGMGSLAQNANNHFGIKCKSYWQGPTYYIEDDDFQNGKLIKSCFRAYEEAGYSYQDNTDFLVGNPRYAALFQLPQTDYKAWAKGLKRCGYATDARYAEKIIRIIEKYQLHQYDAQGAKLESDKNQAFALLLEMEGIHHQQTTALEETEQTPTQAVLPNDIQRSFLDTPPTTSEPATTETEVVALSNSALPPAMVLPNDYKRNSRDTDYRPATENTETYIPATITTPQEPGTAITGQEADFVPASDRFIPKEVETAFPAPTYQIPASRMKKTV